MMFCKLLMFVCATILFVEAKRFHQQKREATSSLCDPGFNNTNKIQCYCTKSSHESHHVKSADCYPTVDGVTPDDQVWDSFYELKNATKVVFTNTRGVAIKYIPRNAFKHTKKLMKLDVKYGSIETIEAYALANLSSIKEIALRDNQIKILKPNSFARHPNLKTINLDSNMIVEINRDVFIDLPSLEKIFLTNNKITTIHDRAFVHLTNLKELEIDRNNIFSLNSESFSGLKSLEKLDLSSNSLEVIGDNTFLPLNKLRILNLVSNKIQMIDERGFHGLSNLQVLSLAHNMLKSLDNINIFVGLNSLSSLSLKANQLQELKKEVMAPILNNFYSESSSLDVEDINFPCDCRLDWLVNLMNKTKSSHLKQTLENLKCVPDAELREKYNNSNTVFEEEQEETQKNPGEEDYEFYDDTQLNGKLFYTDLSFLLNCSGNVPQQTTKGLPITTRKPPTKVIEVTSVLTSTKATPSRVVTTTKPLQVTNQGLLDLFSEEAAKTESDQTSTPKPLNQERKAKTTSYTTTRLATVSPKPIENKYEEHRMASDEAKPDNIKAHRSIQEEIKDTTLNNNAKKNIGCIPPLIMVLILRFY